MCRPIFYRPTKVGLGDGGGVFGGISVHVHVHTSWTCTSHVVIWDAKSWVRWGWGAVGWGINVHVHVHISWTCTSHVLISGATSGVGCGGVGYWLTFMYMFIHHWHVRGGRSGRGRPKIRLQLVWSSQCKGCSWLKHQASIGKNCGKYILRCSAFQRYNECGKRTCWYSRPFDGDLSKAKGIRLLQCSHSKRIFCKWLRAVWISTGTWWNHRFQTMLLRNARSHQWRWENSHEDPLKKTGMARRQLMSWNWRAKIGLLWSFRFDHRSAVRLVKPTIKIKKQPCCIFEPKKDNFALTKTQFW